MKFYCHLDFFTSFIFKHFIPHNGAKWPLVPTLGPMVGTHSIFSLSLSLALCCYTHVYTGIVTGWGCTFCLHTVVGECRLLKDFLDPLPGPKSRSAVCGNCRSWPFTLLIYSYV